jgi:membrane-associated phospholipid phosphatase/GNAT superfamily N-acetyltransferase
MVEILHYIDIEILYFFNHSLSSHILDRFFSIITNVNNWFIAYIILLFISFFKGGIKGKIAVLGVILLIIFTDQVSYKILKEIFHRPRPCMALTDIITPLGCNGTWSFPSNHAVNNFAAATFYYILFPRLKWALFITAALVSISRVYLGLHYPSDILGGAIIGSGIGYLFAIAAVKTVSIINERKLKSTKSKVNMEIDMKEKLVIRESTVEDIPLIFDFIKELAEYEKMLDEVTATKEILKNSLFGKNKYAEVVIAEFEGKPAGQVLFFHNFSTFKGKPGIYIEDIYVKSQYRGKGIGKALFSYLKDLAKERNCGRVEWVVLNWNKSAINFYEKIGAEPMNDWTTYRLSEDKF